MGGAIHIYMIFGNSLVSLELTLEYIFPIWTKFVVALLQDEWLFGGQSLP